MGQTLLREKQEIMDWLDKHNVKRYKLIEDNKYGYVVNVRTSVILKKETMQDRQIKVKFNCVMGDFNCTGSGLESLIGCPEEVQVTFNCSNNQLKTLEYSPKEVFGNFICSANELMSLKCSPKKIRLESIKLEDISELKNFIYLDNNPLLYELQDISYVVQLREVLQIKEEHRLLKNTIANSNINNKVATW